MTKLEENKGHKGHKGHKGRKGRKGDAGCGVGYLRCLGRGGSVMQVARVVAGFFCSWGWSLMPRGEKARKKLGGFFLFEKFEFFAWALIEFAGFDEAELRRQVRAQAGAWARGKNLKEKIEGCMESAFLRRECEKGGAGHGIVSRSATSSASALPSATWERGEAGAWARGKFGNRGLGEVKLRCEGATRRVVIRLGADLDWGRLGEGVSKVAQPVPVAVETLQAAGLHFCFVRGF